MAKDLAQGIFESFHDNGQRHFAIPYERGKIHGKMRRWEANGQLIYEAIFVEDVQHGPFRRWHANGQDKEQGTYENGKLHGTYIQWDEASQEVLHMDFVQGEPVLDEATREKIAAADAQ